MSAGRDRRGDDDGGFLGRWSERKLKARAEPEAEAQAVEAPIDAAGEVAAPKSEAEILEELGLPDPDTLVKGDDFSGFMRAAVPSALRSRALRRLWLTDPVLANLDGLNDYEQDFTDAATVVKGGVKTLYKVGRGLLRDVPEPDAASADAEAADPETAEAASEQAGASPDEVVAEDAEARTPVPDAEDARDVAPLERREAVDAAPQEVATRPARMRFRFDS